MADQVWVCAYSIRDDKWRVEKLPRVFADEWGLPSYPSFDDALAALKEALANG